MDLGPASTQWPVCSAEEERTQTHTEEPCEEGRGGWRGVATAKGRGAGRSWKRQAPPLEPLRERGPVDTLTLAGRPPEPLENKRLGCLVKATL